MISQLTIRDIATYPPLATAMTDLKAINYIYGANGSGKTTISRVIASVASYPSCSLLWNPHTPLECLVYNRDFRDRNFDESSPVSGVFTLGEKNVELLQQIADKHLAVAKKISEVDALSRTLEGDETIPGTGKRHELIALDFAFSDTCWKQKVKHDEQFQIAFAGVRDKKDKFRDRLILEHGKNKAVLLAFAAMETKALTVFGASPAIEAVFAALDYEPLTLCEVDAVLQKAIIGSVDVNVGSLIKSIANADWVGNGRSFLEKSDPQCPFCQQVIPTTLKDELEKFFDRSYMDDCKAVATIAETYDRVSTVLREAFDRIILSKSARLNLDTLRAHQQTMHAQISKSVELLKSKKIAPSIKIALQTLANVCDQINAMLDTANVNIKQHNIMVKNLSTERATLTAQVWRYLIDVELKSELPGHIAKRGNIQSAIDGLTSKIGVARNDLQTLKNELAALEKQTTSVKPTMDAINKLLASFGFTTFSLSESATAGAYELVRGDGSLVHNSLSDGERTFLTTLYFYHLIQGSGTSSGTKTSRVIVFDDPISSLDSDVLFVVSSLVKNIFKLARDKTSNVKQVFLLTHNIYFHKEITFDGKRSAGQPFADESFWIVKRKGPESSMERCAVNPVKSSYELLWAEVRNATRSSLTICNALRRILENYFKLLGGQDLNLLFEKFDGEEKTICRSLVSWINDGSHFAMDDLYLSQGDDVIEKYLDVFRKVFETQNHEAHYKMMMGDAFVVRPNLPSI